MESPVKTKQLAEYFDTPANDGTNLYDAFLDMLILTDEDMPTGLAQAIWLMVTTERPDLDAVRQAVAYAFHRLQRSGGLAPTMGRHPGLHHGLRYHPWLTLSDVLYSP